MTLRRQLTAKGDTASTHLPHSCGSRFRTAFENKRPASAGLFVFRLRFARLHVGTPGSRGPSSLPAEALASRFRSRLGDRDLERIFCLCVPPAGQSPAPAAGSLWSPRTLAPLAPVDADDINRLLEAFKGL